MAVREVTLPQDPRRLAPLRRPLGPLHLYVWLGLAIAAWTWAGLMVEEDAMAEFGLITVLPVIGVVALAAVLVGFVVALAVNASERVLGAYGVAITLMFHALPVLAYDHLRFSWAWKHVGVVEYIMRTGSVDPDIAVHPVYHNWPGFFGLNAWITRASGLESALSYAAWAPVVFNLLFLGALYMLFRSVTADRRLTWTALVFFTLGNWVGQDYFAPQAFAFFLYLMVLAMVLRWYSFAATGDRLVRYHRADVMRVASPQPGTTEALTVATVLGITLLAIASTHQLTPIATLVVLVAFRLTRVIRVTWPIIVLGLFVGVWLAGPALPFVEANVQSVVTEVGGFDNNLDNNLVAPELFSESQLRISQIARLLSGAVAIVAALGWWRRLRNGVPTKWLIVAAAAPASLVLLSSYGGEVLFRAYLFALPFAAFLGASLWFPSRSLLPGRKALITLGAVVVALGATLLIADFGADNRQVFSDAEVAAADFLFENAQPGALIVEGSRDYPRQHRNYEQFVYLPLDRSRSDTLSSLLEDPAERIAGWMSDTERYSGGYVIITQSQRESVTALGTLLSPTLDAVEDSLRTSDRFEVVFEQGDAVVFAPVEQP